MNPVEFLPERIRLQRQRQRRLIRQGYLLAACLLVMGVLTYCRHIQIASAQEELAGLDSRAINVGRQVEMIAPLERQMADLLIKKRIDEELGSRTDVTAVLSELCHITPSNMALVSLDMRPVEVRPDSARGGPTPPAGMQGVKRVRLTITGIAPSDVDVANFIGQLSASLLFEDVNMGYTRTVNHQGRSAREFQASCYLSR